jgi:hypothetical protein
MSTYVEVRSDPTLWERIRSRKKEKSLAAAYGVLVAAGVVLAYLLSLAGFLPADPDAMDLGAMNSSRARATFWGPTSWAATSSLAPWSGPRRFFSLASFPSG